MKEIFLSFNPKYFKPLLYGMKKYEYRKRFCNEETIAYLYLSVKSRQVVGIMELGIPIRLDLTRNNYKKYPDTLKRVDKYIANRDINAVPIKSLTLYKKPIGLDEIREKIKGFMPPQMYYNLETQSNLKELLMSRPLGKKLFVHEHDCIYYDNLARSVIELEKTAEFKTIHQHHTENREFVDFKF